MTHGEDTMPDSQSAGKNGEEQRSNTRLSRSDFFKIATASALGAAGALMSTSQPTLAAPLAQQAGAASREKKIQSSLYYIKSALTGFVLDIPNSNTAAGTLVSVYPKNSPYSYNQLWFVSEDGYIQSLLNGFVLDSLGGGKNGGDVVTLYPRHIPPTPDQHWFFSDTYIYNGLNGMVLDVTGSNTAPGASVIIFPKNSFASVNQQWKLVPAF
ncbi:MAG: ricin-type beta-trefoil lectin domain protein [Ktedonobacteraceae bacterium]|nr:ricin-type beta-trefoil lectin domain protein [Ktedonobacteraceae bacterium]